MKRPLTILSYLLTPVAIAGAFAGFPIPAAILCVLNSFLAFYEVKIAWGRMQLLSFLLANISLGFCLDLLHPGFPSFTIALFCMGCISSTRMFFFEKMGYTKLAWYEPAMLLIASGLYITSNIGTSIGWAGWVFPAIPLSLGVFMTGGTLKDIMSFQKTKLVDYAVEAGKPVPDFTLPDHEGNIVNLSELKGKRHLLLLFVRGDWCPSCHIMLRTYEKNREKFQEKDIMILAIGPDPIGVNKKMVLSLGLDYKILSDTTQEVVKRFGIQMQESSMKANYDEGIPMPASFLVDKKGIVRFTSRADRAGDFLNQNKIFDILPSLN
jgi:peroxiredoxin